MTAQQLKNSILQMAVQGKLVPQDPSDEPASVLLQRIKAEKQELIKAGKIKKDKKSSEIFRGASRNLPYAYCEQIGKEIRDISDEIPFEIPESWEWVRLDYICEIARGGSPRPIKQYLTDEPDGVNWIKIGDSDKGGKYINSTKEKIKPEGVSKSRFVHAGDFLLTNSMSFGRPYILNVDGCIHDGWLVLSGYKTAYDKDFLFYMLSSKFAYYQFCDVVSGAVVKNLNSDKVANAIFPLPPINEQRRIVARIEELLPYIEKYGKAEEQLTALNTTFPEALKKSILQEAVQGKLVPQNPDDEPASVLLERIRAEKQELIKAGKIKRDKHESVIVTRDKIPYEIPDSWVWCTLGSVINLVSGQDYESSDYNTENKGIPYLTGASNIENGTTILNRWTETPRCIANKGDLLVVCKGAGVGKMCILEQEQVHIARQIMSVQPIFINIKYIKAFLEHNLLSLRKSMQGVIPGISRDIILSMPISLPPIAEQHRIVAKIEEIMPYINTITK